MIAAKHLQWALNLSPDNKNISESVLLKEHHCDNNPKVPCNLAKPDKHKVEGSDTITPPNYMPSSGGDGGYLIGLIFSYQIKIFLVLLNLQAIMASTFF